MDGPKTVAEEVPGVQTTDVFVLLREISFWRVVAENMSDRKPYSPSALDYAPTEEVDSLDIVFRLGALRHARPHEAGPVSATMHQHPSPDFSCYLSEAKSP